MLKKLISLSLSLLLMLTFSGCSTILQSLLSTSQESNAQDASQEEGWAMYWYLCGSDLETEIGAATEDMEELFDIRLPENVTVVIQTGGAYEWQNDYVRADRVQRFVYDQNGLELVYEGPQANMGEADTLAEFLEFASSKYPAEHTVVNLWNHGGASLGGIAYDELYDYDSLDLDELQEAFSSVYLPNPLDPPVDIIGFDACLMATLDVAETFQHFSHYMVASEEMEPANGWNYRGMFQELAKDPEMPVLEFSRVICDTYIDGCEYVGTEDDATLSVVNLTELAPLLEAYESYGKEALAYAIDDPSFFADFSKIAIESENYGGNTRQQGYYNMVDLGHLADGTQSLLPQTSSEVLAALENCVEYRVYGRYRSESTGLSCYYSYSGDLYDFSDFTRFGISEAFKHLYYYGLTGDLRPEGIEYVSDLDVPGEDFSDFQATDLPEIPTLTSMGWDDAPVTVTEDGYAVLDLGSIANEVLSTVTFQLFLFDVDNDVVVNLGTDNDLSSDWENGIFEDDFRGVWGSLDGALCYMEIAYEGDEYTRYSVPVLLNDVKYNLSIVYDFAEDKFEIEGARLPSSEENHLGDRNLVQLEPGDIIQPLHFASTIFGERGDLEEVPTEAIIVTEHTQFYETDLFDGTYVMLFEMRDTLGNTALSSPVTFEVEGDNIRADAV